MKLTEKQIKNLDKKINEFSLSSILQDFVNKKNLIFIKDLAILKFDEILNFSSLSRKTIDEIDTLLSNLDLHLGIKLNEIQESVIGTNDNYIDNDFKKIKIEDYNKHRNNRISSYLEKSNRIVKRIENTLNSPLLIKDLAENSIDLNIFKKKKNIGKNCIYFLNYFSKKKNIEDLILNRPDLAEEELKENSFNEEQLELKILDSIEDLRKTYNDREKTIFDSHFGFKHKIMTLEGIAREISKFEHKKVTRERIRQITLKLKDKLVYKDLKNNEVIKKFLIKNQYKGFHKIFPKLDKYFTKTSIQDSHDIKNDRLTYFLESFCGVREGTFVTPEIELKTNFKENLLKEIFSEVPSPVEFEDFKEDVMEIYGYRAELAESAIEYMQNIKLIKIIENKIYPMKLSGNEEVAHILLKFPRGLWWKDIYEIMNESETKNIINSKSMGPRINLTDNPKVYLSSKGTYKHLNFFEFTNRAEEICKNTSYIFLKKKINSAKVIHLHNIIKKNKIKPSCNLDYYEYRSILKIYGEQYGIYFQGRSSVDTAGISKDFRYYTLKENVYSIIKNSKKVINENELVSMLKKDNSQSMQGMIGITNEKLFKEQKIMRVGPKQWYEIKRGLNMCNLQLIFDHLNTLFDKFKIISVNYFTKYINEKLDLGFSYYYYDSIFKIYNKKKFFYYSNFYLSKEKITIGTKKIYEDYFEKQLNLTENIEKINKLGIAVLKTQFLNAAYYYHK